MSARHSASVSDADIHLEGAGPLYHKLRRSLEEAILSGRLGSGEALSPERDLADSARVSRVTVRKAIDQLVRDGLLVRRRGSGTFVSRSLALLAQPASPAPSPPTEDMFWPASNLRTEWLERQITSPSSDEMMALGLSAGAKVARLARLRISGGLPFAIERSCVSVEFLANPLSVSTSIYAALQDRDARPVRAIQRLFASPIREPDASVLGVADGAAGLLVRRVGFLHSGRPVEFTCSLCRGDTDGFVNEFTIPET
ncbi:GntR family transcriptional regulator [Rhizobium giardinii]|uniref:GntR family transcriptional regulator n=1 Tax=Rhizobium giardinii TaxID=56731 RepID=A0A7W8X9Y6_9HYPH|nr:GntR family transcriptional regulator [Rhizobium giardinii]MBB5538835.1 GntR family transcriptional regulator [Rhizobium giardinii]